MITIKRDVVDPISDFPITKEQIINHLENKASGTNQNMDDILKLVQSKSCSYALITFRKAFDLWFKSG
jgi:hypothetical protein